MVSQHRLLSARLIANAEFTSTQMLHIDFLSNGFKIRTAGDS